MRDVSLLEELLHAGIAAHERDAVHVVIRDHDVLARSDGFGYARVEIFARVGADANPEERVGFRSHISASTCAQMAATRASQLWCATASCLALLPITSRQALAATALRSAFVRP